MGYKPLEEIYSVFGLEQAIADMEEKITKKKHEREDVSKSWTSFHIKGYQAEIDREIISIKEDIVRWKEALAKRQLMLAKGEVGR